MRGQVGGRVSFKKKNRMGITIGKGYKIEHVDLWPSPMSDIIFIIEDDGRRARIHITDVEPYWESELERLVFWDDYEV